MSPTRRVTTLVLGVVVLAGLAMALPLEGLPDQVGALGPLAPVVGIGVGAALLIALVPRTPISVACGVLFGSVAGIACAVVVALVAAAITFAAGRWLGRDFVERLAHRSARSERERAPQSRPTQFSKRWAALERWISREGMLAVAAVRAAPVGPYGLVGYAYGTSNVRVRDYALGTAISAIPSGVTYALLGAAIAGPGPTSPITFVPLVFGFALAAVVVIRSRRRAPQWTATRAEADSATRP